MIAILYKKMLNKLKLIQYNFIKVYLNYLDKIEYLPINIDTA